MFFFFFIIVSVLLVQVPVVYVYYYCFFLIKMSSKPFRSPVINISCRAQQLLNWLNLHVYHAIIIKIFFLEIDIMFVSAQVCWLNRVYCLVIINSCWYNKPSNLKFGVQPAEVKRMVTV